MIYLKKFSSVGIIGYGAYIPYWRIKTETIAKVWGKEEKSLGVEQKVVASTDEDCLTMAVEASQIALKKAKILPSKIGACFVGSESHPYAVKPTGTILAQILGISDDYFCADLQFACKAATTGMQIVAAFLEAGLIDYGLVVGSDKAQSMPSDALEYTAASGAAAFVLGRRKTQFLAEIEFTFSFNSDTPDFWRRNGEKYPAHTGRFTGEPGYFAHIKNCAQGFFEKTKLGPRNFAYAVFHAPNKKFPQKIAKSLGFSGKQIKDGLLVSTIGNSYAACSLIGLVQVLDKAKEGKRIFLASYGSGAGSDCFSFKTTKLLKKRNLGKKVEDYLRMSEEIDYPTYLRMMEVI